MRIDPGVDLDWADRVGAYTNIDEFKKVAQRELDRHAKKTGRRVHEIETLQTVPIKGDAIYYAHARAFKPTSIIRRA